MKKIILVFLIFTTQLVFAQKKFNHKLKAQLDSVVALDQKYREAMTLLLEPGKADSVAKSMSMTWIQANNYFSSRQMHIDSANIAFAESVLNKYGYPGKSLVGSPTNEAIWNVIQHSNKIDKYLPFIKKAAAENELPFHLYAMMLDRSLMNLGQEQVYGSQLTCRVIKTGKNECFVWPIKDAETVNERRKKAGFDLTVERNARRLGVTYHVVKMDEVK